MNFEIMLHAGISTGTILLIAAIGEIFAERSGVMNLGVEGMMLLGAMAAFKTAYNTGNVWLALLAAVLAGGVLSLAHALVTIHFQADQTVSGLSLTFGHRAGPGAGRGHDGPNAPTVPNFTLPLLSQIPFIGRAFFTDQNLFVYLATCWRHWPGTTSTRPNRAAPARGGRETSRGGHPG